MASREMDGDTLAAPGDPLRCRCFWDGRRCPNRATQEDGLCNWCGDNRPCMGGGGQAHINVDLRPDACWMIPKSGQVVLPL